MFYREIERWVIMSEDGRAILKHDYNTRKVLALVNGVNHKDKDIVYYTKRRYAQDAIWSNYANCTEYRKSDLKPVRVTIITKEFEKAIDNE